MKYLVAETRDDALRLMREEKAVPISGGTSFVFSNFKYPDVLVDITRIRDLKGIKVSGNEIIIGAGTTLTELMHHDAIYFREALKQVGTTPLRNMITLGGSIYQVYYWSDLPVVLLALDSKIVLTNGDTQRTLGALEFFKQHPRKTVHADELIEEIIIPANPGKFFFSKFSKTVNDFACATVAMSCSQGGKPGIACGAISTLPFTIPALEDSPDEETMDSFLKSFKPFADFRYSAEYRLSVLRALLREGLSEVLEN